jgi:hypothetical protein
MLLAFGEADIRLLQCCEGSTVVITNANNDVVAATGLVAGTYTSTATGGGKVKLYCYCLANITQPEIQSLLAVSLQCYVQTDGRLLTTNSQGATW